ITGTMELRTHILIPTHPSDADGLSTFSTRRSLGPSKTAAFMEGNWLVARNVATSQIDQFPRTRDGRGPPGNCHHSSMVSAYTAETSLTYFVHSFKMLATSGLNCSFMYSS